VFAIVTTLLILPLAAEVDIAPGENRARVSAL